MRVARRSKALALLGVIGAAFAVGSLASGAAGWKVFATGRSSGDYGAVASASADAPPSRALAVRVASSTGKMVSLSVLVFCQVERKVRSGSTFVLSGFNLGKCNLSGQAQTDYSGPVRLELLRR